MFNENLKWYFPASIEKAVQLINQPGVILHAGGTRILKTQSRSINGLVDVGKLKLNYLKRKKNLVHIGSAVTFSEVVNFSRENNCLPMLGAALSEAASTPLRNRITIGGSIKDFPLWSNLFAPLIALDAKLEIHDGKTKIISIEDYINGGMIKTKHLIKEVIAQEDENIIWRVKRFSVLKFEYPLFNIAAVFKMNGDLILQARLIITGVKTRYKRFSKAENIFEGKIISGNLVKQVMKFIEPKFISDYQYSARYKERAAKICFEDILIEMTGVSR